MTICKLIDISKKFKEQIEPIDEIKFDYDSESKSFIWIIRQAIVNEKEGLNKINELIINASNSEMIEIKESGVIIIY